MAEEEIKDSLVRKINDIDHSLPGHTKDAIAYLLNLPKKKDSRLYDVYATAQRKYGLEEASKILRFIVMVMKLACCPGSSVRDLVKDFDSSLRQANKFQLLKEFLEEYDDDNETPGDLGLKFKMRAALISLDDTLIQSNDGHDKIFMEYICEKSKMAPEFDTFEVFRKLENRGKIGPNQLKLITEALNRDSCLKYALCHFEKLESEVQESNAMPTTNQTAPPTIQSQQATATVTATVTATSSGMSTSTTCTESSDTSKKDKISEEHKEPSPASLCTDFPDTSNTSSYFSYAADPAQSQTLTSKGTFVPNPNRALVPQTSSNFTPLNNSHSSDCQIMQSPSFGAQRSTLDLASAGTTEFESSLDIVSDLVPQSYMSVTLDITNLVEVMNTLKKAHFPFDKFEKLGLNLGLYRPTISEITNGDNDHNLMEILSKWLEKADGVDKKGGPTVFSLVCALEDMDQNATANKVKRHYSKR